MGESMKHLIRLEMHLQHSHMVKCRMMTKFEHGDSIHIRNKN